MGNRVTTAAAIIWSLAATAAAQSGAKVTMPPDSRQTGRFPFLNSCPTAQMFKVSAQPPADWLRFDPATVEAAPGISFMVRVTANSANRAVGTYRTTLSLICASCAASNPPCLQNAKELPIELAVANVRMPGEFEPIHRPPSPIGMDNPATAQRTVPYIPPVAPPPPANRFIPIFAAALLAVGALVLIFAMRALAPGRKVRLVSDEMSAESQRHQVRR
jgi:hypothetical protein